MVATSGKSGVVVGWGCTSRHGSNATGGGREGQTWRALWVKWRRRWLEVMEEQRLEVVGGQGFLEAKVLGCRSDGGCWGQSEGQKRVVGAERRAKR